MRYNVLTAQKLTDSLLQATLMQTRLALCFPVSILSNGEREWIRKCNSIEISQATLFTYFTQYSRTAITLR